MAISDSNTIIFCTNIVGSVIESLILHLVYLKYVWVLGIGYIKTAIVMNKNRSATGWKKVYS